MVLVLMSLAPALAAQGQGGLQVGLDRHMALGSETPAEIPLTPKGCWEGLLLSVAAATTPHPAAPPSGQRRVAEATVEVWDVVFQETRSQETFRLFRDQLLLSIRQNWRFAPPSHGRIEAGIRAGDGRGGGTDMAMTQSLQQRFNALPPNGSPLR